MLNIDQFRHELQETKDNPWRIVLYLNYLGFFRFLSDKTCIKLFYRARLNGKRLNLKNPQTFNEKIQWLKLYDRKPEYTQMVDKYEVKKYIAERIGEEHVIPTLGVWDKFEDIDFNFLPNQFVLKCTHDSGGFVICRDKSCFDKKEAGKKIKRHLKRDYYKYKREWPYKMVKPRVIAEQYMEDTVGKGDLTDYKLHFFSGECKAIMVGQNRFGPGEFGNDYYTPEWEHFDFTRGYSHNAPVRSSKPEQLDEMISLGKKLAMDYPFVRIDLYVVNGKIYFGEITFYPASGFNAFHPEEWDKIYGDWIKLPLSR